MTTDEAIDEYKKLTYDLAKVVDKLTLIKSRMQRINTIMEWDGMFECDFSEAIEKLASVEAAAIEYCFEDEMTTKDSYNVQQLN